MHNLSIINLKTLDNHKIYNINPIYLNKVMNMEIQVINTMNKTNLFKIIINSMTIFNNKIQVTNRIKVFNKVINKVNSKGILQISLIIKDNNKTFLILIRIILKHLIIINQEIFLLIKNRN